MRVVLDTNVLVSGLLNPYGPPGRIVRMVAAGELTLWFDARILGEYREVLIRREFGFLATQVDALVFQIVATGEPVSTRPLPQPLPDPDDEPFLEVAIAGNAEYLVTGNTRHFPAKCRRNVRVVSPATFMTTLASL
jgi:putative PIN family toxin of toxin-antitoxin system